jgi:hypothetical protein
VDLYFAFNQMERHQQQSHFDESLKDIKEAIERTLGSNAQEVHETLRVHV